MAAIAELLGEGFTLPTQGRDPDLLYVVQLEAIRAYLASNNVIEIDEPPTALQEFRKLEPVQVQAVAQSHKRTPGKARRK